jgi:hypothetical protein
MHVLGLIVTLLLQCRKANADGVGMSLESFAVGQRDYHRSNISETWRGNFLRRDVLLEGKRVDAAELASVAICGQSVVGARGIITAAAGCFEFRDWTIRDPTHLSGV